MQAEKSEKEKQESELLEIEKSAKPGKKGKSNWSYLEDKKLIKLYKVYKNNWKIISDQLNDQFHEGKQTRTNNQCRERYINYFDPKINHNKFTSAEDAKLIIKRLEGYK